jgi:hypothetical protein
MKNVEIILLVKKLREQVENFDSSSGETCDNLIEQLRGTAAETLSRDLGKALNSYEFDIAKEFVEKLLIEIS